MTKVRSIRLGSVWDWIRSLFVKLYSISWRTGLFLFVFSALCFVYSEIKWQVARTYREVYSYQNYLGKHIKVKKFANGTCYTYDYVKDKRISPRLRWVSTMPERDSLTVFCDKNGRRGFLNANTGKIMIEGQYERAWHFSEGLAAVQGKDGRIGFINHENELVIPMEIDYVFGNEYIFRNGYCLIQDKESRLWGVIDREGEWKHRPELDGIYRSYGGDGCWIVEKGAFEGLLDLEMNYIFEPVYDNVELSSIDGTAYLRKGAVKQHVAFNGDVLEPFVIDRTEPLMYPVGQDSEGATLYEQHPTIVEFSIDDYNQGVMDSRTGEIIVPAIYDCISMISRDLIGADISRGIEKVIYTTDGRKVK